MRKALAWVTSLCLASSLFGMPAMSFAEEDGASRQTADQTNDNASASEGGGQSGAPEGVDASSLGADIPVINEGDSTTIEVPDSAEAIGGVVNPSTEASAPQDASVYLHFQSYAPAAAVGGLAFTLEGPEGTAGPFGFLSKAIDESDDAQQAGASASENAGGAQEYYARVSNLAAGSYVLRCTGQGFAPYEQTLELQPSSCAEVALIDSTVSSDVSGSSRGIMLYGDFDGSGAIDRDDAHALVQSFEQQSAAMDLYGSGSVGLEDVQFFATFFLPGDGVDIGAQSRVVQKVDPTHMTVVAESTSQDNIEVTGDLGSLFVNDGNSVSLAPAKGADGEDVAISTENPIRLIIEANNAPMEGLTLRSPVDSEGMPRSGIVLVEQTDGTSMEIPFGEDYVAPEPAPEPPAEEAEASVPAGEQAVDALTDLMGVEEAHAATGHRGAEVDEANGLIVVDFGTRVAIKKITIRITATSSNKLAEIAQVEFLNDMEERIAPPELNIPRNLVGVPGKKQFRVNWSAETNVTGYEVRVSQGGATATFSTVLPTLEVSRFNGGELKNETEYMVSVRSVNGDWRSPWSEAIGVTPKATDAPGRPTGVAAIGGYGEVTVKWNSSEDAQSYVLYYRQTGESNYTEVTTTATSFKLSPLPLSTEFNGYVVAVNDIGRSPSSEAWKASTSGNSSIKMPQYRLINQQGNKDGHITKITAETDDPGHRDAPNSNELNPGFQPEQMVDGNYDTYFHAAGRSSYNYGASVEFDQAYTMDRFAVTTYLGTGYDNGIYYFTVRVRDANGQWKSYGNNSALTWERVSTTNDSGVAETVKSTWMVNFPKADVTAIRIAFTFYNYDRPVTISELAFYEYDGIQEGLDSLWADGAMYTELRPEVTQATLDDLEARINERSNGELHPKHALFQRTLDYAKDLFANQAKMDEVIKVDPALNPKVDSTPVGGLSDLQPLGVTVRQGDQVSVFVGMPGMNLGSSASALQLVVAPYHAAPSGVTQVAIPTLKPGRNDFTVSLDNIASTDEAGGQLYVRYVSSTPNQQYTVRVMGGTKAPLLDLHGVTDQAERLARCEAYITELTDYVAKLRETHAQGGHGGSYVASRCTANVTDIVIDHLMYSIPAEQALAGINGQGGTAASLENALSAGDELMDLYYQHKGLKETALTDEEKAKYGPNNLVPKRRQNVRYMDMSGGVFMYAAGNHIGIQYGSCTAPTGIPGVTADENGLYQDGRYFGWGLAHEIGHEINQGCYTYAEVTNNYYSQLALAHDSNEGMRWGNDYSAVYNRVTSGLKGAAGGKTGIAMYWQLHLAYDDGYNYKTYGTYDEEMENLVFARMDSYARNQSAAPKAAENGFTFTLAGADKDNALMRLACAATQKNLLGYFEAWGLTPDGTTQAYAQQWPVEERAIQYITDDVRKNGRLAGMEGVADKVDVAGTVDYENGTSQVTINLTNNVKDGFVELFTGSNQGRFLGYEVLRNGVPVGFVEAGDDGSATFTDTIATVNNRVFSYTVRGVDMLLNRTAEVKCSPEQVKVSHDGNIAKGSWSVTGNVYEDQSDATMDDEMPCEAPESTAAAKMIDNDKSTVFNGTRDANATGNAQVTINFGGTYAINAIKFANGYDDLSGYTIQTSLDGASWTTVNQGEKVADADVTRVYFGNPADAADKQLHTVDAGYLRLTAPGTAMSIAELDVLGPTGDNVEFLFNQGENGDELAVGRLKTDYVVSEEDGEVVPADSTVIIGSFKGNAAYNAIKLYDQDGKILPGAFLFYQDVTPNANIGETADGRWVYFITPSMREEVGWVRPTAVRAELYRVDDALTLEGERLVADTISAVVPDVLTGIEIKSHVSGKPTE